MKVYMCQPLELKRRESGMWLSMDYKCMAVEEISEKIKDAAISCIEHLFDICDEAYIIIWFFDGGLSQPYFSKSFKSLDLVLESDSFLLYKAKSISEIGKIVTHWGVYDGLDIYFPKIVGNDYSSIFPKGFYKNYRLYRNAFLKRVQNSNAIISDSGDGAEMQIILSKNLFDKNILQLKLS